MKRDALLILEIAPKCEITPLNIAARNAKVGRQPDSQSRRFGEIITRKLAPWKWVNAAATHSEVSYSADGLSVYAKDLRKLSVLLKPCNRLGYGQYGLFQTALRPWLPQIIRLGWGYMGWGLS